MILSSRNELPKGEGSFREDKNTQYDTCKHCVFYHCYHLVWSTKYRYKVLTGALRLRVRDICRQVCRENEVDILRGVLSSDHVHMFVSVPPKLAIPDLVRRMKGRSSHRVQREFPEIRKRCWGCRFWGRGYFSTTNGAITEDIVLQYLENHIADPTGASR
jgi:REP-associated tyrosine transposase